MEHAGTSRSGVKIPNVGGRTLRGMFGSFAGNPDLFGSERSFSPPIGCNWKPREPIRGYYIDFSVKAEAPAWPPYWFQPIEKRLHVATAQWGLGAYERFLTDGSEEWLEGAIGAGTHLVEVQADDGGWSHPFPMPHTYMLDAGWISAITQGESASLLIRLFAETGDSRYEQAARLALEPMLRPSKDGGTLAYLDGSPFVEEYPTDPPSFVLNGAIFGIFGFHDVGLVTEDQAIRDHSSELARGLARNLWRYDTGAWSRYDLFPHPLPNLASPAYHLLQIRQLTVLAELEPSPEFAPVIKRFEAYRNSGFSRSKAIARKVAFRISVPRSTSIAHRLPWSHAKRQKPLGKPRRNSLVLCYHAVSPDWNATLSVTPEALEWQINRLLGDGYQAVTFEQAATGAIKGPTMAVTFDDAYASVSELAEPILSRLGVVASLFVPTRHMDQAGPMSWPGIDRWIGGPHESELIPMGWDAARALQEKGWEIGSHTVSHPHLTTLSDADLRQELEQSRAVCAEELGRPCGSVAYPFGDVDQRVARATMEAGYTAAAALPTGRFEYSRLTVPRVGIYHEDSRKRFGRKTSRTFRTLRSSRAWRPMTASLQTIRGVAPTRRR